MNEKTMSKQELEIILEVDELGNFNLEVVNGDGKNCLQATQKLEKVLGVVNDRKFKPEVRQNQKINQTNKLIN